MKQYLPIAGWCTSNFGGLMVLVIEPERILTQMDYGDGKRSKKSWNRIRHDEQDRAYIVSRGSKFYLDEALKTGELYAG